MKLLADKEKEVAECQEKFDVAMVKKQVSSFSQSNDPIIVDIDLFRIRITLYFDNSY